MDGPVLAAMPYRWVILLVTFLAQAAVGAPATIFVLAVFFQTELQLSKTGLGFLSSALSFGIPMTLLVGGWIADRFSTRRVLVAGLLLTGLLTASVVLVHSFTQALLLFLAIGAAIGIAVPALMKSIVIWFPRRERGFAMGLMRTGVPLMAALAASTLPALASSSGWRLAVTALAVLILACALVAYLFYEERVQPADENVEMASRRRTPKGLLKNRNIWLASVLPAILTGAQFTLAAYLILFLMESLFLPVVLAGVIMAVVQISGAVGRILWGVLSDRAYGGQRKHVLLLIGVASAVLLAMLGFLPVDVRWWIVGFLGAAAGATLLGWHGVYTVLLPELSGRELAGSAVGLGYTLIQVGAVAVPPLFGYILDVTGDYRWAWGFLVLLTAVGSPVMLLVKERHES